MRETNDEALRAFHQGIFAGTVWLLVVGATVDLLASTTMSILFLAALVTWIGIALAGVGMRYEERGEDDGAE